MEKCYETCEKCKYDYTRHCVNVEDCFYCEMYNVHSKSLCKCFTIHHGEDCPYFVKAEEVDE